MRKFLLKIKTLAHMISGKRVSFRFLFRYGFGQLLAYSGIGKYISFKALNYKLYLTRSPVAMVAYGSPYLSRDEEQVAQDFLTPNDICLDIGANIGTFSLVASKVIGEKGKVFAFEAHPKTVSYMKRNIKLNESKNIVVINKALGEVQGVVGFSDDGYDDVNHVSLEGDLKVDVIRLDDCDVVKNINSIGLIKLDVEGFELFVLRGGEKTFSKAKYVLFEAFNKNCEQFGYSVYELYTWFNSHGFSLIDSKTKEAIDITAPEKDYLQNILAVRLNV